MNSIIVPAHLRARLGQDGSEGLVEMFGLYHQFATDRFERRLTEETSALRIEMHQGFAAIRQDMASMEVRWIKWSFLFWVSHLAITFSVMAYMLDGRYPGPHLRVVEADLLRSASACLLHYPGTCRSGLPRACSRSTTSVHTRISSRSVVTTECASS